MKKSRKRPPPKGNPWRLYEARKAAFEREHPYATPRQWQDAMQKIARELGI